MSNIYLAGPIKGLTYEEAAGWRGLCLDKIGLWHKVFNPLLASDKEHVGSDGKFHDGKELDSLVSDMFFTRDMYWVINSDIIIANFTIIPESLGTGTIFELGAAFALKKIIILVGPMENIPLFASKSGSVHFNTIEEAIRYVNTF